MIQSVCLSVSIQRISGSIPMIVESPSGQSGLHVQSNAVGASIIEAEPSLRLGSLAVRHVQNSFNRRAASCRDAVSVSVVDCIAVLIVCLSFNNRRESSM